MMVGNHGFNFSFLEKVRIFLGAKWYPFEMVLGLVG
jgi:hypothetical protein